MELRAMLVVPPLQNVCPVAEPTGLGLTVTVTVKLLPGQAPDVGVTVYVAVCAVLVVLVSVPVMLVPEPAAPPVIPPVTVGAVQEYVVPAGMIFPPPLAGVAVKPVPLQVTEVMLAIVAFGLTVTVMV